MTKDLQIALDYCAENIWEWETRVSLALDKIAYWRYPLQMADPSLYDDIIDALAECAEEYEIDADSIEIEDLIFA